MVSSAQDTQGPPESGWALSCRYLDGRQRVVSRELRLRRSSEFDCVRHRGRSWSSRFLVLSALANGTGKNRYGFAVGRKVGGAVERNRAKRVMREAIRELHPRLQQGFDVVVIARNSFTPDLKTQDVVSQLATLARRATLLREDEPDPPGVTGGELNETREIE